jgi:flagellar biogenesis protein FliO
MDEGGWVLRTLVALAGVSALAWAVLSFAARRSGPSSQWARWLRGVGGDGELARLRVIERLALGPQRELYLVQADARVFLLGSSAGGPIALLAELEREPSPRMTADSARVN